MVNDSCSQFDFGGDQIWRENNLRCPHLVLASHSHYNILRVLSSFDQQMVGNQYHGPLQDTKDSSKPKGSVSGEKLYTLISLCT